MTMVPEESWKTKLYASYVSSGQAGRKSAQIRPFVPEDFIYFNKKIRPLLPENKKARILDLGCGHGGLIYCLKQWGYQNVVGIDTSHQQVELAREYGIEEVVHGDLFDLLAGGVEPVQVVFLMDVIEHLTRQELFDLLTVIRTRMSRDGLLVMHMPNAGGIFGNSVRYGDMTHEQAFTDQSIQQCLKANGFTDVRVFEDKPIPHGIASLVRRIVWEIGTFPIRLLYVAESGGFPKALSQNLLVTAVLRSL